MTYLSYVHSPVGEILLASDGGERRRCSYGALAGRTEVLRRNRYRTCGRARSPRFRGNAEMAGLLLFGQNPPVHAAACARRHPFPPRGMETAADDTLRRDDDLRNARRALCRAIRASGTPSGTTPFPSSFRATAYSAQTAVSRAMRAARRKNNSCSILNPPRIANNRYCTSRITVI